MSRREEAATATVGLTGVAGAAAAREHVIRRATKASGAPRPKAPRPPSAVLLRRMPGRGKLRAAYLGTTALGLTAGVPAVTGTTGLFRRDPVGKALRIKVTGVPDTARRAEPKGRRGLYGAGLSGGMASSPYRTYPVPADVPRREIQRAYRAAGFRTSSGKPRTLGHDEVSEALRDRRLREMFTGANVPTEPPPRPQLSALGRAQRARGHRVSKVTQEERIRSFIGTGVKGSGEALRAKATNVREPVPAKYRAGQAGVGLGAGALGAQLTHAALNRAGRLRGGRTRAAATALGATLTGAATLPATSAGIHRVSHGKYRATPTGVVRAKTLRKPASSKATLVQRDRPVPRGFEKRDPKTGYEDTPFRGRLARVYASGAVPGPLGPINAARQAGRMAPQSQQRSATVRQYAGSQGAKYAGAALGGIGLAAASHKFPKIITGSEKIQRGIKTLRHKVPGMEAADRQLERGKGYLKSKAPKGAGNSRLARVTEPLRGKHAPATAVGALAGSQIGGHTGTIASYRYTYDKERRRGASQARRGTRVGKAMSAPGMSRRETEAQIKRKRRNIAIGTLSGAGGLGSLGVLGAAALPRVPHAVRGRLVRGATYAGTAAAGLGGVGTLESQRIARRDVRAQEKALKLVPASKAWQPNKGTLRTLRNGQGALARTRNPRSTGGKLAETQARRILAAGHGMNKIGKPTTGPGEQYVRRGNRFDLAGRKRNPRKALQQFGAQQTIPEAVYGNIRVGKAADPIKTYGDRGPLPKGLPREEKMRAYAARVEHHGGRKAAKWQRRASAADATRNALVAGATGAGVVLLTGRSKHVANVARKTPLLRRAVGSKTTHKHAETAALATGTGIGAAELYGDYARSRRASYRSSPGGAAQSALTRMQANTPGGAR